MTENISSKVWADLKVGDEVVVVDEWSHDRVLYRSAVAKIGRRWITLRSREMFSCDRGYRKDGGGRVYTEATLAEAKERQLLQRRLEQHRHKLDRVPLDTLRRFIETLESL